VDHGHETPACAYQTTSYALESTGQGVSCASGAWKSLTKYCWGERIQRLLEPALYRKTDEASSTNRLIYSRNRPTLARSFTVYQPPYE